MLLDKPIYFQLRDIKTNEADWHMMFRAIGYVPLWLILSIGVVLYDRKQAKQQSHPISSHLRYRGFMLFNGALLGGLLSGGLKVFLRRERPILNDGEYVFRPFDDDMWDGGGLGLPSGHTAVAFGGMWMMSFLFPVFRPICLIFACGCAFTRLFRGAHFFSDTYVSAVMMLIVCWLLWRWHVRCIENDRASITDRE